MKEVSFGIIPLKQLDADSVEVFMIQHREGHWGFPKGRKEKGETPKVTAERELEEETGLRVTSYLELPKLEENYHLIRQNGKRRSKVVTYFTAWVEGDFKRQEEEVSAGAWHSIEDIVAKATHPATKKVCAQLTDLLKPISS